MTSQAGSVPIFKIQPHYIHAATTDQAMTDRLVSLGMDRKQITSQHITEARKLMLEAYYRANEVAEKYTNRQIRKEFKQAEENGSSKEAVLEKAQAIGMQKTGEKFERIKDRKCEACGETALGKVLQRCAHCFTVSYCGKECQKSHWKQHKAEWLQHDKIIKETLVTGGFTAGICQLIADYDHTT